MWQVYLYLANERQARGAQTARLPRRGRRWHFGRRPTDARTATLDGHRAAPETTRAH